MSPTSQDVYLSNQVLTASPYKLRLMLIDGALRLALTAKAHWETGEFTQADDAISRSRKIVAELLRSAASCEEQFAKPVASVYSFVMRSLTEARLHRELSKLDDVIRVLRAERETWQAVCEQIGNSAVASGGDAFLESGGSPTSALAPDAPPETPTGEVASDRFSFEA